MAIRLDKVKATAHLVSIKFATNLKNGCLVKLGALATDGEAYTAVAVADVATDRIVLHASPELMYNADGLVSEYELVAGKVGRAYVLEQGDIITITDDNISGTTVVGQFVIPEATKVQFKASATNTTEKLVGTVVEKGYLNGSACTTFVVTKAV